MYVKARGLYNLLTENGKNVYDTIIEKTTTETFKKFTKKELAYLYNVYEKQVGELILASKCRNLTSDDAYILAISVKLRNLLSKRNIIITHSKYNPSLLDAVDKYYAETKLTRTLKPILR